MTLTEQLNNKELTQLIKIPATTLRFLQIVGPVFRGMDAIQDVLYWRNPMITLLSMLTFIVLCLHPTISMCLVPLFIISLLLNINKSEMDARMHVSNIKYEHFLDRITKLNNLIESFCDIQDSLMKKAHEMSEIAQHPLVGRNVVAWFVWCIVVVILPFNYQVMLVGLLIFIWNTPVKDIFVEYFTIHEDGKLFELFRTSTPLSVARSLSPPVLDGSEGHLSRGSSNLSLPLINLNQVAEIKNVYIFEYQRYWVGLGWVNHLLPGESGPWVDSNGSEYDNIQHFMEQKGLQIISEWRIERLPITDDLGWVYLNRRGQVIEFSSLSFVRRRLWKCECLN